MGAGRRSGHGYVGMGWHIGGSGACALIYGDSGFRAARLSFHLHVVHPLAGQLHQGVVRVLVAEVQSRWDEVDGLERRVGEEPRRFLERRLVRGRVQVLLGRGRPAVALLRELRRSHLQW